MYILGIVWVIMKIYIFETLSFICKFDTFPIGCGLLLLIAKYDLTDITNPKS